MSPQISTVAAWDGDELGIYAKVLVIPDGAVHLAAPEGDGWSPTTMCRRGRNGGLAPREWESFATADADNYCGGCPTVPREPDHAADRRFTDTMESLLGSLGSKIDN